MDKTLETLARDIERGLYDKNIRLHTLDFTDTDSAQFLSGKTIVTGILSIS